MTARSSRGRRARRAGGLAGALSALAAAALVPLACTGGGGGGPSYMTRDQLLDPQSCQQCHADHFKEWSGSMHAYAAEDPVFRAMNARGQRETGGQLGAFCVNCHAPMAVAEGATKDGTNLDQVPQKLHGVTCFFCHTVDAVQGTHNAPLRHADDLVLRGPYADPVQNTAHRAAYSALHDRDKLDSASMCGACHDIQLGHGTALERTFAEWQASVFSHAPGGQTCGQCHMAQSANLEPIAQAPGVFARRRHAHTFAAVDSALTAFPEADAQKTEIQNFLNRTLQSALCVSAQGPPQIRVLLDNVGAGHDFPSGASQDRRLWVEMIASKAGQTIYQSGVVPDGAPPTQNADSDMWLLRDCLFDTKGSEVHMFWQAASTEGNELPAQATFDPTDPRFYQTHIVQSFPRDASAALPVAPDQVTMRVRLMPMGLEVLQDLVKSGDLDASVVQKMTTIDVGAGGPVVWTPQTATDTFNDGRTPFSCVTTTSFNVQADKVPATNHTKCAP